MNSFLHLINLLFHEAGHIIFSPFGQFMTMLGGSLMQVLVPIVCAGASSSSTTIGSRRQCASGGRVKA